GQGLSAIVRTRDHVLVFDAGPRHASGSDAGRLVVIPYLKSLGVQRVDALVVSHADQDHAGGVAALRAELNVDRVWMGDSDQRRFPAVLPCRAGEVWAWDAVQFKFLHPQPDKTVSAGNEGSCVLSVKAPGGHVLLTGDIGFESERLLLQAPEALDADVLVVPHHGSAGSSSPAFVAAVSPNWALVSAGYGNRYGFPKAEVVDRYQRLGASVDVTGHSGAIRLVLPSNGEPKLENWRESGRRYWHEPDGCHADLAQGSARLQWCGSNAKSSMMPH
ncbi:MAG: ComEC/Rec2 family competence protein, partial [Pseudomonadota bacterium]|nr:ComEC/Rec2 family competence protein [Pseudomonadota bacterium]